VITTIAKEPHAAIARVVERGVRLATLLLQETTLSPGGTVRPKPQSLRREQTIRLDQLAEVLDLLRWYGPWGQTSSAIRHELVRRATTVR